MKKFNVLLIDDDEVNTFFLQHKFKCIKTIGDVHIAINGQDALVKLDEFALNNISIDIILLDINMPVMNGFEFLDIYQSSYAHKLKETKVYVVTTSGHVKDEDRANKFLCVEDYLDKGAIVQSISLLLEAK